MRSLSLNARVVIERLMIEHMHHAGTENGALPVTYDNFVAHGVRRGSIRSALREAEALGLIEIIEHGYAGKYGVRSPH